MSEIKSSKREVITVHFYTGKWHFQALKLNCARLTCCVLHESACRLPQRGSQKTMQSGIDQILPFIL